MQREYEIIKSKNKYGVIIDTEEKGKKKQGMLESCTRKEKQMGSLEHFL